LIAAGSETTATFLTGTTYYLLKSPTKLQRLTDEVRSSFTDSSNINGDNTQSLPYLFAVIVEGLRIFPPVPIGLQRTSPGASVDGYWVPAGSSVSVTGWVATHQESHFHSAREFHPERWLPSDHPFFEDRFKNDMKEASKPFSLGPRVCLGVNLAYMEMRIILARLIWEFDWELLDQELVWERDNMVKSLWQKPKLMVKFKPAVRA